jgi:hypothetical protein
MGIPSTQASSHLRDLLDEYEYGVVNPFGLVELPLIVILSAAA